MNLFSKTTRKIEKRQKQNQYLLNLFDSKDCVLICEFENFPLSKYDVIHSNLKGDSYLIT